MTRVALFGAAGSRTSTRAACSRTATRSSPWRTIARRAPGRSPSATAIPRVTTDWEALAADPDVEAAVVSTPNALHAPQAIALLRNGKHVMVEKPMATSVAECDEMIEASRDDGRLADGRALLAVPRRGRSRCATGSRPGSWARS